MKTLLVLSALLALSFATSNYTWETCNTAPNDTYIQPINATLNITGLKATINYCGKAKENMSIHGYSMYTFIDDSKFAIGGGESSGGSLPISTGQEFCYESTDFGSYTFPANYTFQIKLKDDEKNNLNCLNVTLTVPFPKEAKQLAF